MNDYSTTIHALDARIEEGIAAMSRERDQLIAARADEVEVTFAEDHITRLARLLTIEPVLRRAVEALQLTEYSMSSSAYAYDNVTIARRRVQDVYSVTIDPIQRAAAALLTEESASEYLLAHANDPSVWHALKTANAPDHLLRQVLLARPGVVEQHIGARHLIFLDGGTKVVVDASVWYGPVTPVVLASAGVQRGGEGPRFLLYGQTESRTGHLAVELSWLRFTTFKFLLMTYVPKIEGIDATGITLRQPDGALFRRYWEEPIWARMKPFDTWPFDA